MTTGERLTAVENSISTLTQCTVQLTDIMEQVVSFIGVQWKELAAYLNDMAGHRRDVSLYQRLWVHLAGKHGWLEDEDWPPPEPRDG